MGDQKHNWRMRRKRIEMWLGRIALMAISRVVVAMPERAALRTGAAIGSLAYRLSKRYRTVAINNLTQVFGGEWDAARIADTAQTMFRHLGMGVVEFVRFPAMDAAHLDAIVRVEGEEHAREALARGHGVVAVTSHYGNFELFGAAFVRKGYPLSVIARDADDAETNDFINNIRERMGYRVFARNNAARQALGVLRRNQVLGVLPDQNDISGIFVPFFGRLAATATGPAYLAIRTGAAVLPAFIHRETDNTHVVKIFPPIEYTVTDNLEADVRSLTAAINLAIETAIREHPEEWFWLHNRWKMRPPEERDECATEAAP